MANVPNSSNVFTLLCLLKSFRYKKKYSTGALINCQKIIITMRISDTSPGKLYIMKDNSGEFPGALDFFVTL